MSIQPIRVTCAIVEDNGKILAAQRGEDMSMPLKWEFPGGKVEPGEMDDECIVREMMEEMDADIEILYKLPSHIHDYGTKKIELIPYVCRLKSCTINIREHKRITWDNPLNLENLDWAEADISIYNDYVRYLKGELMADE